MGVLLGESKGTGSPWSKSLVIISHKHLRRVSEMGSWDLDGDLEGSLRRIRTGGWCVAIMGFDVSQTWGSIRLGEMGGGREEGEGSAARPRRGSRS